MRYPENRLLPWLIAAALLVNGAAGWWFAQQRALRLLVPSRSAEPGPAVPTLVLLSEQAASTASAPSEPPEAAPGDVAADRSEDREDSAVGPPDPPGEPAGRAPDAPDAQDEPAGPPGPLPAAEGAPPEADRKSEALPLRCVLIGPGGSALEVGRWRSAIAGPDVMPVGTAVRDEPFVVGYRVILSTASPEDMLARLAAAGFDGFVSDRDERGAHLSLGLFEVRANAERQLAQLRKQGFAAEMQPQQETHKTFWLQTQVSATGLRAAKAALRAHFPGTSPVWRDCRAGG